jgi:hypothetical protein
VKTWKKNLHGEDEVNMFGRSLRQKAKNIAIRIPGVERSLSLSRPRAQGLPKGLRYASLGQRGKWLRHWFGFGYATAFEAELGAAYPFNLPS